LNHLTNHADNGRNTKFSERKDAGAVQETLNSHIEIPAPADELPAEARFKLKANTEILKFGYKTMAMKLSEASEILDDRIEEFLALVQKHHKLDESAFGNPAAQSQEEIVAVGRICSDSNEGKLNASSVVLETSRRLGGGRRVPLKLDKLASYQFFPGKIVALRGINASGEFFSPTELLSIPYLLPVASEITNIDAINDRISDIHGETRPLTVLIASGPYTTDDALDFSPFNSLLAAAQDIQADGLILCGPFIDAEHPLVQTGDFDLPANYTVSPDKATLLDLFKAHISYPLAALAQALPSISIVMCPSVRDAVSKHVAWPQDRLQKKELGLPRQASMVPNPMLVSLNETQFGISSQDILDQIRSTEVVGGKLRQINILDRLSRQLLEQRHFFPVFPPVIRQQDTDSANFSMASLGPCLDLSYMKLGEFLNVNPDVLVTPSVLPPFAKVS
jgi:DNA polymerase alpha subunit B